jgi:hypothetical protein
MIAVAMASTNTTVRLASFLAGIAAARAEDRTAMLDEA